MKQASEWINQARLTHRLTSVIYSFITQKVNCQEAEQSGGFGWRAASFSDEFTNNLMPCLHQTVSSSLNHLFWLTTSKTSVWCRALGIILDKLIQEMADRSDRILFFRTKSHLHCSFIYNYWASDENTSVKMLLKLCFITCTVIMNLKPHSSVSIQCNIACAWFLGQSCINTNILVTYRVSASLGSCILTANDECFLINHLNERKKDIL